MSQSRRRPETSSRPASSAGGGGGSSAELRPAYKSGRCVAIFLAIAAAGAAADLLSKHFVFSALLSGGNNRPEVVPGLVRLTPSTNPGIVFGIRRVPRWVVMIASAAAAATVVFLFATSPRRSWGLHVALGMVLSGSIGNTYDRLFSRVRFPGETLERVGQVRDFIDVYPINYPVFNVADILLVVGVLLILLHMIRQGRRRKG